MTISSNDVCAWYIEHLIDTLYDRHPRCILIDIDVNLCIALSINPRPAAGPVLRADGVVSLGSLQDDHYAMLGITSLMANQYPAHHCAFTARETATSLFISTPLVNPDMPMDGYTPEPVGS